MVLKHGFAKAKLWNTCHTIGSHHRVTPSFGIEAWLYWTQAKKINTLNRMCYTTGSHTPLSTISEGWLLPMGVYLSSFLLLREMNKGSCQGGQNWIIFALFYVFKWAANSTSVKLYQMSKEGRLHDFSKGLFCACCIQGVGFQSNFPTKLGLRNCWAKLKLMN